MMILVKKLKFSAFFVKLAYFSFTEYWYFFFKKMVPSRKPLFLKNPLKTSKIIKKWWFRVFTMEILWSTSYFGFIDFWSVLAKCSHFFEKKYRKITWGGKKSHLWVSKKSSFFSKIHGGRYCQVKTIFGKNSDDMSNSPKKILCVIEKNSGSYLNSKVFFFCRSTVGRNLNNALWRWLK